MKLVIVESDAKALTIGKYLGKDYKVVPSYGHISDLPLNEMGIDIANNFSPRYVLLKNKVQTLQLFFDLAQESEEIILATDPDREGSVIANNIKNYLNRFKKPISRVIFNEITKNGIMNGIKNKGDIDHNQLCSAINRRIIDRLVGFLTSPYLMRQYNKPMSAGRVQSAVVKLIVDLEKEIENFKKEEFWNISAKFSNKNKQNFVAKLDTKIKNREEANEMVSRISNQEGFLVSSVIAKDKSKKPDPPLITVRLQQIMAREYGWDTDRVMKSAQFLYEQGLITYLRTDSVRVSDDALEPAREYLKKNGFKIPTKSIQYSDKNGAQSGHECLRPTNIETTPDSKMISGDDRLVYKTIFEHFLASQMTPAIYSTLQIKLIGMNDKKLIFKVSGKALKDPGYLAIFGKQEIGQIELPMLSKDEPIKLDKKTIKSEQKFTQPPSRYNEASILEKLEKEGIGRPATYASIIGTITSRNYVEKQGSIFKPTDLGKEITGVLEKFFSFVNHNYTSDMEIKLDQVAEGKLDPKQMLNDFYSDFKKQLDEAYIKNGFNICPCGGIIIKWNTKDGKEFFGCDQWKTCKFQKKKVENNNEEK